MQEYDRDYMLPEVQQAGWMAYVALAAIVCVMIFVYWIVK